MKEKQTFSHKHASKRLAGDNFMLSLSLSLYLSLSFSFSLHAQY